MSQMLNQSSLQPPQPPKESSQWLTQLRSVGKRILNNWPTKLLALVLAVALWGGLITQDPMLTREKSFRGVKVNVIGADTLRRNGRIVTSDLDALLGQVSLTANVPQMQYSDAQASDYNVHIDLSSITESGEQEIAIRTSDSSTYGAVESIEPSRIRVTVEDYINEGSIPVNVEMVGEPPAGFYVPEPTYDPARITVSGPRSLVERVEQARAVLDLSTLEPAEKEVERALSFVLLDGDNQVIDSDMLQVTVNTVLRTRVNVRVKTNAMLEIPVIPAGVEGQSIGQRVSRLITGRPSDGYQIVDVIVTPDKVGVAGKKSVVDTTTLRAISPLSVSGRSETFTGTVKLMIPENVVWSSHSQAEVTVVIEPVRAERVFTDVSLKMTNVPEGMTALGPHTANVTVNGHQTWVETLQKRDLSVTCDVADLQPGEYELPLTCSISNSEGQEYTVDIEPMLLRVTIEARE